MQVLWRTAASDGEHALLMLGWPEACWHLELVHDPALAPEPTEEDLLVLYLAAPLSVEQEQALVAAGGRRVRSRNPYWDTWGSTFEDGDGYRLVLSHRQWSNAPDVE